MEENVFKVWLKGNLKSFLNNVLKKIFVQYKEITNAEYNNLPKEERNSKNIIYNIIDAEDAPEEGGSSALDSRLYVDADGHLIFDGYQVAMTDKKESTNQEIDKWFNGGEGNPNPTPDDADEVIDGWFKNSNVNGTEQKGDIDNAIEDWF